MPRGRTKKEVKLEDVFGKGAVNNVIPSKYLKDNSGAEEVHEPLSEEASDKVVGLPEAQSEEVKAVIKAEKKEDTKAKINPPNPVRYTITCGVCHTNHAATMVNGKIENRKGSFMVLESEGVMDGIPLIEILCKRCGCAFWKIAPEVTDQSILKAYGNMALKRG